MAGALESSITLEDVFAMVGNKRVPLAPELAGYLALEIAEGADEAGGGVDPRSVYIAEEGTVALVKRREPMSGDAEASIRAMLSRLLEASGSKTAALTAAARRRSTGSLRALSEELEAALIPVNRAAGRRALARLAREVKRVTMRVGRSAGTSPGAGPPLGPGPIQGASPRPPEVAPSPSSRPPPASERHPAEEATTARRAALPDVMQKAVPSDRQEPRPVSIDLEEIEEAPASPAPGRLPTPGPLPPARPPSTRPRPPAYSASDVDSLLADFARSSQRPDQAVARDLKAMAGLDPTPPPPSVQPPASSRPRDSGVE